MKLHGTEYKQTDMLQYLGAEDSGSTRLSSKPTIPTRNWARFSESGFDTDPLCTPPIREIPECGKESRTPESAQKPCPEGVSVSEPGRICLLGVQKRGSPKTPASAQTGAFVLEPAPLARKEHRRSPSSEYLRPESARTQPAAQPKYVRAPSRSGDLRACGGDADSQEQSARADT